MTHPSHHNSAERMRPRVRDPVGVHSSCVTWSMTALHWVWFFSFVHVSLNVAQSKSVAAYDNTRRYTLTIYSVKPGRQCSYTNVRISISVRVLAATHTQSPE
ncbi:hypothetical protein EJ03DRAFT_158967 [Teratosphaeria nubilosa]|uniref:Uncharacterized protein n=1 Tax=Teratosphaeria nubilosa TaxID=161662 RepID=A0A6G1L2N7_9PEZI|nr:hypothetical protein EJ03DRAFT_158967 [Teratosphaeria nubilosa]